MLGEVQVNEPATEAPELLAEPPDKIDEDRLCPVTKPPAVGATSVGVALFTVTLT